MKRKFGLMFRVMLALVMLTAFGAVVNAPVSAQQESTMTVDVNAYTKSGMTIIPIQGCLQPSNDFYINAAITAGESTCTDVMAEINRVLANYQEI